jgi:hypothetical protein
LSVVGRLQFDRWDIAAVLVEAVVVEPVDPFGGGQFDFFDGAPGLAGFDQLGLVEAVDRLGQRVVVGASDCADTGLDAGLGKALGEPDRGVLRTPVSVWTTSLKSRTPSCWRVQMACSIASSTIEVAMVAATRQPRMRRA